MNGVRKGQTPMAYRESNAAWGGGGGAAVAEADCVDEGWKGTERRGDFAYRESASAESARFEQMARDEAELLRQDFRRLRMEARSEFKNVRARILRQYEERLVAAKEQYLEDAVASRERLLTSRQAAREEYEDALRNAKNNYEFTVDIVKDQYQTIRKETTRVIKLDEAPGEAAAALAEERGGAPQERASTRVIERLDAEIRKIAAKKAAEAARLGDAEDCARMRRG